MDLLHSLLVFNIFAGGFVFCSVRGHLLSMLLSLEFMVLSIFLLMTMGVKGGGCYYSLFYLIITACEGALGLSLLIMMSRSHGGDYFSGAGLMTI